MGVYKDGNYFRADAILVRKLEHLTIIFYDSYTIYVYPDNGNIGSIFNRWDASRGSYVNGWKDFRRRLLRKKNLTVANCYEMAIKYGVVGNGTLRKLDLSGKKVRTIYE